MSRGPRRQQPPSPPLHAYARSGDWNAFLDRLRSHPWEAAIPVDDEAAYGPMQVGSVGGGGGGDVRLPSYPSICDESGAGAPRDNADGDDKRATIVPSLGLTALHLLCARRPPPAVVSAYLSAFPPAALSLTVRDGRTPLHLACYSCAHPSVAVELLRACPAAAAVPDHYGRTPLHVVCRFGAPPGLVESVVRLGGGHAGEALTAADCDGRAPLHVACDYFAGLSVPDFAVVVWADPTVCYMEDVAADVGKGGGYSSRADICPLGSEGPGGSASCVASVAAGWGDRRRRRRPVGGGGSYSSSGTSHIAIAGVSKLDYCTGQVTPAGVIPLEILCREYGGTVERAAHSISGWSWLEFAEGRRDRLLQRRKLQTRRRRRRGSEGADDNEERGGGRSDRSAIRHLRSSRSFSATAVGDDELVLVPAMVIDDDTENVISSYDDLADHMARIDSLFRDMDELKEFWGKACVLVRAMTLLLVGSGCDMARMRGEQGEDLNRLGQTPPTEALHDGKEVPPRVMPAPPPFRMLHACLSLADCPPLLSWFSMFVNPAETWVEDERGDYPLHIAARAAAAAASSAKGGGTSSQPGRGPSSLWCDGSLASGPAWPTLACAVGSEARTSAETQDRWEAALYEESNGGGGGAPFDIIGMLVHHYPPAAARPNGDGHLPLQLVTAMPTLMGGGEEDDEKAPPSGRREQSAATTAICYGAGWDSVRSVFMAHPSAVESLGLNERLYPYVFSRFASGGGGGQRAAAAEVPPSLRRSTGAAELREKAEKTPLTWQREEPADEDFLALEVLFLILRERPGLVGRG